MYFRMAGGNRGFVFKNGNNPVFQIDGNGQLHGANGRIQTPDAFVTTNSSGVRMVSGNYGAFWHQNGSHLYLMMTNSGNQYGSYNGLRPFYVSLADGKVNMRQGLDMGGGRINNVATPAAATDVANKAYVDSQAGSTYAAGTGISISGTTVSFNTSWGDGRYALRGRTIGTGLGLTGGGNLTANRQISLRPEYQRHQAQTNAVGLLAYNGHNRTAGQLYGGGTNPASTVRLNYDGSLYATRFYSTAYYYFSDRTLKKDIETIDAETGMGIVRDLRPVSYAWRQNDQKALGVIAQEVEEIIPTAVTTNEEGLKAVDYIQMIAPMLAAIQELDERVQVLEAAAN